MTSADLESACRRLFDAHAAAQIQRWSSRVITSGSSVDRLADCMAAGAAMGWTSAQVAAYLLGHCRGLDEAWRTQRVDVTWTGPRSAVPVRATAAVLLDVIAAARTDLILMTYSAKPLTTVTAALAAARARGVRIDVVVETVAGAGGAISPPEPASAFLGIPRLRLWHWPTAQRGTASAKMHAKLAVADRRQLLLTSANLTQSGTTDNLEAGVVIRGGEAPGRVQDYVRELQRSGQLEPLPKSGG